MSSISYQRTLYLVKAFVIFSLLISIIGCRALSDMLDSGRNNSTKDLPKVNREKPDLSFDTEKSVDVDPDSDQLVEVSEAEKDSVVKELKNGSEEINNSPPTNETETEKNQNALEKNEPERTQSTISKDADIISKTLWKLDDESAANLDLSTPVTIVFGDSNNSGGDYIGEMQISSHGTATPATVKYTITSNNTMILSDEEESKSANYKISDDGKTLQINFDSGERWQLTEY